MFDKLEDLVRRFEEITNELTEPSVVNDQNRFRKLMKEQSTCSRWWMPTQNIGNVRKP